MKTKWTVKFNSLKPLALLATAGLATQLASGQCVSPPPGLVAWWPGDGNGLDIAGGNHGTLRGNALATSAGMVNQAFSFGGGNDCVSMSRAALNQPFKALTIEAWVLPTAHGHDDDDGTLGYTILSKAEFDGFAMRVKDGFLQSDFRLNGSGGEATFSQNAVPLGQWSHVALTYDGTFLRGYLNGQILGAFPASGTVTTNLNSTTILMIGNEPTGSNVQASNFGWRGLIDEVSVYSRALSSNEIVSIFAAAGTGKCRLWIVTQPQSQIGYWGKAVSFSVSATNFSTASFSYHWLKDATLIPGATNTFLTLTNLQLTNAGAYVVLVSDPYGNSVTSKPAYLTVNPAGVSIAIYAGVTIDGVVGQIYGVQSTLDLSNTNSWAGRANVTLTNATQLWYDSQPASQPQTYYRVLPGPISIP